MKKTFKPMIFILLLMISMISCNNEELFVEPVIEVIEDDIVDDTTDETEDTEDAPEINTTVPCAFNLDNAEPNSTIIIDCILDLDGKSVNLPSNVVIEFNGGDIVNGTIVFSNDGVIDAPLLNSTLTIAGVTPQVKDPTFHFKPERWGIVEGEVPQEVAARNNTIINDILIQVKELGVKTFKIDKLDAYFYNTIVVFSYRGGIEVPSNMNLEMTNNTHLRVFVTSSFRSLIFLQDVENIKISGGYLHGARNIPGFNNELNRSNLLVISSGKNIVLENMHLSNSSQDGMNLESNALAYAPNYVPSRNITVRGCTFDSNRRNNLSITDGMDYLVENCTFLNAGIDMEHSDGLAPRFAIDLEPETHDLDRPWQILERVVIRNNRESGSAAGGMVFADGDDYTFEGNNFDSGVFLLGASNVKILNNTVRDIIDVGGDPSWYGRLRNKNTIVSGNTVIGKGDGKGLGIRATNQDVQIFDNHIINMGVGIQLNSLKDSNVYNNIIESTGIYDDGINALNYLDNVVIENNTVTVKDFLFYFDYVNYEDEFKDNKITLKGNTFNCTGDRFGFFSSATGIDFINNTITNGGVRVAACKNVLFQGNTMSQTKLNLEFSGDRMDNLKILNNNFQGPVVGSNISGSGNKNIEISNNSFKGTNWDEALRLNGYHGLIVKDNSGTSEKSPLIIYTGNNSTFTNNNNLNTSAPVNIMQGINNLIN